MTLPTFDCPVCRNPLTWDIVFAHQGVREAMLALVNAHPEGRHLLRPLLGYITLFAPKKTAMRYERIAALANELVALIGTAQIERDGAVYAAPAGYWQQAFEDLIAKSHNGTLRTPLTSHGYLLEVLAGYAKKAEVKAETTREAQRAGHAGVGTAPPRRESTTTTTPQHIKSVMPQHVRDAVRGRFGPITQEITQEKT